MNRHNIKSIRDKTENKNQTPKNKYARRRKSSNMKNRGKVTEITYKAYEKRLEHGEKERHEKHHEIIPTPILLHTHPQVQRISNTYQKFSAIYSFKYMLWHIGLICSKSVYYWLFISNWVFQIFSNSNFNYSFLKKKKFKYVFCICEILPDMNFQFRFKFESLYVQT